MRSRIPEAAEITGRAGPLLHGGRLGDLVGGQLTRLCDVAALDRADAETYAALLTGSLGPVADRSLLLPPPSRSFLSDDHTPVEYSLAFLPGSAPTLRVLFEPGCGSEDMAENGRAGLRAVRDMAERWRFDTDHLDRLEDLFFPASAEGPLALWCALELRPGGVPKVKIYLNPAANGRDRSAETVQEALARLGHRRAFAALPEADDMLFVGLDLGDWKAPRVKIYLTHHGLTADEAGSIPAMTPAGGREQMAGFVRTAGGYTAEEDGELPFRRRTLTCHSFTETATGLPSGYTVHVPVRAYVRHDGQARDRAAAVLRSHGMDSAALDRALAAVTPRRLDAGPGLIAYVSLVHQRGHPPRVTVYVSSEAYQVQPPRDVLPARSAHGAER
ncbi:tryptophan dimethylallyltransferase family protein [Actinacidiphila bryophytorum]|uniref:Aromatic prenyltransferase, DMATS type n=1 Tax=Actinacidiphila bryophytorum TaxID=1436133 RepID=A0A9W4H5E3_9ACTN|nr:tryptophan dimethylallyltransferase family protein [Actinacidiphila bryophytorum]CAG7651883.1 Aromatic prenyltransferase, DMATS type [Actinacidiphila bryophytorum]